jgi:hypothetical protein
MIKMKTNVTPGETPAEITVSMIDQDLKNGISKPEMAIKYGIKPYEVDEMFKHPFLKGRRPSRKKALSFSFVDDVSDEPIINPNQVTLEDAITEATKEIETAVNELADVNNAIVDMLSPTDPDEEPKWRAEDSETGKPIELDQDAQDTLNHALDNMVNEDGQTLRETFDKELEEELEMDDDTFEL